MQATSANIRRARPLLGTFVDIDVDDVDERHAEGAVEAAFAAVAEVHRLMSFHEAESDVSRLNRSAAGGAIPVHQWTYAVMEMAADMNRRSAGAFDIGVAPTLQQLGQLPADEEAAATPVNSVPMADGIELLGDNCVRFTHPSVKVDLGGIAKGYAVDRAIDALRRHGVRSAIVNAGGDLAAFGPEARTIHVRDPRSPDRLICEVDVSNQALASTGRRFDPFRSAIAADSAVIEPKTRAPTRAVHGATVRAPSCMIADALTKIVMIAGEDAAGPLGHYRASAIFVSADGDVRATSDWQGVRHNAS
jgi:thiamine biosynthesis lipoprotein